MLSSLLNLVSFAKFTQTGYWNILSVTQSQYLCCIFYHFNLYTARLYYFMYIIFITLYTFYKIYFVKYTFIMYNFVIYCWNFQLNTQLIHPQKQKNRKFTLNYSTHYQEFFAAFKTNMNNLHFTRLLTQY